MILCAFTLNYFTRHNYDRNFNEILKILTSNLAIYCIWYYDRCWYLKWRIISLALFTHLPLNCVVRGWCLISENNVGYGRTRNFYVDCRWIVENSQAACVKKWGPWSYLAREWREVHTSLQFSIIIWNVCRLGRVI
jgi:hypothetical protein